MWSLADQTKDADGKPVPNGIGGSNAGHIYDINGCDAASLTEGIVKARRQLLEYRKYYREYLTGYEDMELVYSASYLGIRESRRVVCDLRLEVDTFQNKSSFDDEIGRYCYPIDIHSPTNDKAGYEKFHSEHSSMRLKQGENYGIPYRSLAVKGIRNLLCAGRCISTDRYMQSSVESCRAATSPVSCRNRGGGTVRRAQRRYTQCRHSRGAEAAAQARRVSAELQGVTFEADIIII